MKLEFVNHASYVLQAGPVRLMCDPWLEGTAFDDGWALLSKTTFSYADFQNITHLWFSHEHPDHFSPPNLRKIAPEHRAKITVLFQETLDKRVVGFLKKANFKEVVELRADQWHPLGGDVEVLCNPAAGFADSWICVKTPTARLLNMNDCWIAEQDKLEEIKRKVGDIDVLATQFGISAWDGNPADVERRHKGSRTMLEKAVKQCEVFAPRYVLPFASFIWFCHEENAYMNSAFLPIDEVVNTLRARTRATPVPLYPGDQWTVGAPFDPEPALARYRADQASLPQRTPVKATPVPPDDLMQQSRKFCADLIEGSDPSRMKVSWFADSLRRLAKGPNGTLVDRVRGLATLATGRLVPALVYVTDHGTSYAFDPEKGLTPAPQVPRAECDVAMSSAALSYAFRFLWGGQTLHINGRFEEIKPDARDRLFRYFHMASNRSSGHTMKWNTLPRDVADKVARKVARFLPGAARP